MQKSELHDLWQEGDQKAKAYYQTIEDEVLQMARKKSQNTIQKFKRFLLKETIYGSIFMAIFFYWFGGPLFWFYLGAALLILLPNFYIVFNTLRTLNNVLTEDIVVAIKKYVKVLKQFERRIKIYLYILAPVAIVIGFFARAYERQGNLVIELAPKTIWLLIYLTGFCLFLIYFSKKYYYRYFVGGRRKELEELIRHLEEESLTE